MARQVLHATWWLIERHEAKLEPGAWHAKVDVGGRLYFVSVWRGKRVRIAYSSKWGHKWDATVRDENGQVLWDGEVTRSIGLVRLLELAGLIPLRPRERAKLEKRLAELQREAETLTDDPLASRYQIERAESVRKRLRQTTLDLDHDNKLRVLQATQALADSRGDK